MSLFSDDKKDKTITENDNCNSADYYYMKADDHRRLLKAQLRIFVRTGAIVIAAFVTFIALTMAWFFAKPDVKGTGSNVSAYSEIVFELATFKSDATKQGVFDDNTDNNSNLVKSLKHNYLGTYTTFQDLPSLSVGQSEYEYEGETYILGDSEGISLLVSNTSNLNNAQADQQMGPGSKGAFTFFVISKVDDLNSVTISIYLDGYTIEEVETEEKTGKAVAIKDSNPSKSDMTHLLNCIQGHLLIYQGLDDKGNYNNQLLGTQTSENRLLFSFEVAPEEGFQKDVPYPVTLYWIWPKHFDGIIVPGTDESVFATSCTGQTDLINRINAKKELVFYSTDELENIQTIADMSNAQLAAWSKAYNRGDQLIGNRVAFFEWIIEATN